MMPLFYRAFIESILSFSIVCWYGNITIREKNALVSKKVKLASKIAGVKFDSLTEYFNKQIIFSKPYIIFQDPTHRLYL